MATPARKPHHRSGVPVPPEHRLQVDLGARFTEMNTILGRIRRRPSGEPKPSERNRLAVLKEEIAELRRGQRE
jgi:hypothetical protein